MIRQYKVSFVRISLWVITKIPFRANILYKNLTQKLCWRHKHLKSFWCNIFSILSCFLFFTLSNNKDEGKILNIYVFVRKKVYMCVNNISLLFILHAFFIRKFRKAFNLLIFLFKFTLFYVTLFRHKPGPGIDRIKKCQAKYVWQSHYEFTGASINKSNEIDTFFIHSIAIN